MSLSRSLNTGTSSLRAHQTRFDVISNNIANVNTHGFKSSRTNFAEMFNQVSTHGRSSAVIGGIGTGGLNPFQVGLGVRVGSITHDYTQGNLDVTNRPLDLAIQGDGFFIYQRNGMEYYSRAGALSQDTSGYLVDSSSGALLQGYNVQRDANGLIAKNAQGSTILEAKYSNLKIEKNIVSPPKQTSNVTLTGNLNSSDEVGGVRNTSINIFDNKGAAHGLNFRFTKAAEANTYNLTVQIDGRDVALDPNPQVVQFRPDGTLITPTEIAINADTLNALMPNTFAAGSRINVSLADPNNLLAGITQFSGPNNATAGFQNGHAAGTLIDLTFDELGQIWGAFSNGQAEVLGKVVLSKFVNPQGLKHAGDNFLTKTPNSGEPTRGSVSEILPSSYIRSNTLEMSNVDLTSEFTNMITTQRAYEAASKIVSTSDEILQTTVNLKR